MGDPREAPHMEELLQEAKAAQEKADEEFYLLTRDLNLSERNMKKPVISDDDNLFDDELLNKDD